MSKQRNPNGSGSYRKLKDGRYEWRQTIDGQQRSISAKTMKELKEKVKSISDLPIIKEKYKTDEWFEKWLEVYIKPLKKKATYDQYRLIYQNHIKPAIGSRKLLSIKSFDIQMVIAKMNEKGLSSWTMKHARKVMNIAFARAMKDKIITENPVIDIEIPIKQAKPRKTLKINELAKIFEAMTHSRWIWSVWFMLVTGMRRGELLALKWADIDWDNKKIIISKSNSKAGLGDTKSSKIHHVPLSNTAIYYLEKQKEMLKNEFNQNKELIFPNSKSEMMVPNTYYTMLARFAKNAGVKASPHCFRHTFVYLTRNKLSLKDLQAILGHDESTQTLDMYGDMINDSTAENITQIDDVFGNIDLEIEKIKSKKSAKIIQFKNRSI